MDSYTMFNIKNLMVKMIGTMDNLDGTRTRSRSMYRHMTEEIIAYEKKRLKVIKENFENQIIEMKELLSKR